MAFTITSYTPTTGPVTGGTVCTVTGTGLDAVDDVLVGNHQATIVGTPSPTSLQFRTPAGDAAAAVPVVLLDTAGAGEEHAAGTQFTYTAVSAVETLVTTLAGKMALDVRVVGDATFTRVRGVTTTKDDRSYNTEDDSDTDSGIDSEVLITGHSRQVTATVKRGKGVTSGNYDAGQEIIRNAADHQGTPAGLIEARWYDRTGGPEAYQAFTLAQWSPQGGNKTGDKADVVLPVQGAVSTIANPVLATPSLAGPYASS